MHTLPAPQNFSGTLELVSGFRKRGLANGVSPFFSENETEKWKKTEKNGRKRKKTERNGKKRKKTEKNGRKRKRKNSKNGKKTEKNGRKRKKRKKTEKIGSDTVPATPFPKDPSVLKIVRRSNPYHFATAVVFQYPHRFDGSFS